MVSCRCVIGVLLVCWCVIGVLLMCCWFVGGLLVLFKSATTHSGTFGMKNATTHSGTFGIIEKYHNALWQLLNIQNEFWPNIFAKAHSVHLWVLTTRSDNFLHKNCTKRVVGTQNAQRANSAFAPNISRRMVVLLTMLGKQTKRPTVGTTGTVYYSLNNSYSCDIICTRNTFYRKMLHRFHYL